MLATSGQATNLATHPLILATHIPKATHPPNLATHPSNLATRPPIIAILHFRIITYNKKLIIGIQQKERKLLTILYRIFL